MMSDELDALEKSWDESKYDPNISLREMWDREEAYRRKKEEEDAIKRIRKQREEEERQRKENERKEAERLKQLLREQQEKIKKQQSTPSVNPWSSASSSTSTPVSPKHSVSSPQTPHCSGPMTLGDYIGNFIGLIFCVIAASLPILFLIYFRKIIKAVVWTYHHFFHIITSIFAFILIGYAVIIIFSCYYAAMSSVKKTVRKTFTPLYFLGFVIYGILCWNLISHGQNPSSVIFGKLPIIFYVPSIIGLLVFLTIFFSDKDFWKFKTWKEFLSFPLKTFIVWGVIYLLVCYFKDKSFVAGEITNALKFYGNLWTAVWQWFIAPVVDSIPCIRR